MKHYINPTIDFVFKILFGTIKNIELLLDFLNKTLQPTTPITSVEILNPYNEREFAADKLSVVDVRAKDAQGIIYHIEVQIGSPWHLPNRILYLWGRQYQGQLEKGTKFNALKPVISIWILTDDIVDDALYHHHFQARDEYTGKLLTDQMSIHLLELNKWHEPDILQLEDHWPFFLKEGKSWKQLPNKLNMPKMRRAMKVLEQISDKTADFYRYQAREDFLREQATLVDELEKSQLREEALKVKVDIAEQERARLVAMLRKAGIEPDE